MGLTKLGRTHDLGHLRGALEHLPNDRRRLAVDGGAHIGGWTVELAKHFDYVHAFEPNFTFAKQIEVDTNVRIHYVALGATLGEAALLAGPKNEGQCHLDVKDEGIPVIPLDSYNFQNLDFLKLDLEGYEEPALRGSSETIQRCRPWIMIEQNTRPEDWYGLDPDGAALLLDEWGYEHVHRWADDHLYKPT